MQCLLWILCCLSLCMQLWFVHLAICHGFTTFNAVEHKPLCACTSRPVTQGVGFDDHRPLVAWSFPMQARPSWSKASWRSCPRTWLRWPSASTTSQMSYLSRRSWSHPWRRRSVAPHPPAPLHADKSPTPQCTSCACSMLHRVQ